jgi:hypothetical protein
MPVPCLPRNLTNSDSREQDHLNGMPLYFIVVDGGDCIAWSLVFNVDGRRRVSFVTDVFGVTKRMTSASFLQDATCSESPVRITVPVA